MKAPPCLTHHGRGHPPQTATTMESIEAAEMDSVLESMLSPLAAGKAA